MLRLFANCHTVVCENLSPAIGNGALQQNIKYQKHNWLTKVMQTKEMLQALSNGFLRHVFNSPSSCY